MDAEPGRQVVERAVAQLLGEHPPAATPAAEFLGARYDAGLAWVHFDVGFGGLGLPASLQPRVTEALTEAGAPRATANYVGVHQGAASVHAFAPDELKRRWLRPAFTNEEWWCQLFSEPGAGSDLAGLATAAVRDGDEWIVNGQKVWTSFAHLARWAILLARTDPDVPKHRGLTFFIVDMASDGVEVRPIHQPDGGSDFSEVFLSDVRVPDAYRLGDVGQGWAVSLFMLGAEREGITENPTSLPHLMRAWHDRRPLGAAEGAYRDRTAREWIANEVADLLTARAKGAQGRGGADALAPLIKLARNRADQGIAGLVVDLQGADGSLGGDYGWEARGDEPSEPLWFMGSRSSSIGGGTSEIMRNLIGERLLGLPGDVRVDKDLPWSKVRRS